MDLQGQFESSEQLNTRPINSVHILSSPHDRSTGQSAAVLRLQVAVGRGREPGPGMTADNNGGESRGGVQQVGRGHVGKGGGLTTANEVGAHNIGSNEPR